MYYSFGSVYSTYVESNSKKGVLEKQIEFVEKERIKTSNGKPSVELITASGIIKKTTEYDEQVDSLVFKFVDVVTNQYAPLKFLNLKTNKKQK